MSSERNPSSMARGVVSRKGSLCGCSTQRRRRDVRNAYVAFRLRGCVGRVSWAGSAWDLRGVSARNIPLAGVVERPSHGIVLFAATMWPRRRRRARNIPLVGVVFWRRKNGSMFVLRMRTLRDGWARNARCCVLHHGTPAKECCSPRRFGPSERLRATSR